MLLLGLCLTDEQAHTHGAVCRLIFLPASGAGIGGFQPACGLKGQPYVLFRLPASCCVGMCQPERPVQYEVFCVRCSRESCVKTVLHVERQHDLPILENQFDCFIALAAGLGISLGKSSQAYQMASVADAIRNWSSQSVRKHLMRTVLEA